MESRINWTDEQWAKHMGVDVKEIPNIRKTVNKYFESAIIMDNKTKQHVVAVYNYDFLPSGFKRPILTMTSDNGFSKKETAIKFANEKFLPSIELSGFWACAMGIPARAIQMLSVKER